MLAKLFENSFILSSRKDFIRLESFVFGHIGDEGFTQSNAAETLRYRRQIGADNVKILTDIKKKHSSHAITADVNIVDAAIAADFFLSGYSPGPIFCIQSGAEIRDLFLTQNEGLLSKISRHFCYNLL